MAQNQNIGLLGQYLTVNTTANTVLIANTATFYNLNGQANIAAGAFVSNAYATLGGYGGNYLAFGQQTSSAQWIQSGYSSAGSPDYYSILLNPLGGNIGIGNTAPSDRLSVNGTTFHSGNVILGSSSVTVGLQANGGYGTSGQVLTSNGTATYWAAASSSGQYTPRVSSTASASSVTPTTASYDIYVYTALAATLTINASTFLPTNGTKLMFRFKDNGAAQTLTWTTTGSGSFRIIGTTLPTATTVSKVTYVGCVYNSDESYWDVIAVGTQA
jgi:hypothetical protein